MTFNSSRFREFLILGVVALVVVAAVFASTLLNSFAQTADTDADGYPDEVEEELGSNQTDPDSTPEHFALLWSCTDGNDNDGDGPRDISDPGCRNTTPGSTPTPTPAPTAAPGGGSGSSGGTQGAGGSGSSGGGAASSASGSSSTDDGRAVLGGGGSELTGGQSGGGDASDSTPGDGSDAVSQESATASVQTSDAAATEADGSSSEGDGGGFPWLLVLLILAALIAAGAILSVLAARSRAMRPRYR